jgi:hypothetical protein
MVHSVAAAGDPVRIVGNGVGDGIGDGDGFGPYVLRVVAKFKPGFVASLL